VGGPLIGTAGTANYSSVQGWCLGIVSAVQGWCLGIVSGWFYIFLARINVHSNGFVKHDIVDLSCFVIIKFTYINQWQ